MSKRDRPEPTQEPLGATELSSLLNGDDPTLIAEGLRRFVNTVREERNLALGIETTFSHEDDEGRVDDNGEDSSVESASGTKRRKKDEDWKDDTANYNVPFVGTSVSVKDRGTIIRNQWPTGLLLAYVEKSPLALELTSDHIFPGVGHISRQLTRLKQNKLQRIVSKQYLKALAELISCAVPIHRLSHEMRHQDKQPASQSQYTSVLSFILKKRLNNLFDLLKSETGGGKGLSSVEGGCGPLASLVIDVLSMLALTSIATARHMARSFEQRLSAGVLRFLVRMPNKASSGTTSRDKARASLLRLVAILLSYPDSAIINCLVSSGSHEKKIPPGLLYLVCKDGFSLSKALIEDEGAKSGHYLSVILRLFQKNVIQHPKLVSRKAMIDILSHDFLTALVNLSTTSKSSNSDVQPTQILLLSDESRNLLFTLLSKEEESPLIGAVMGSNNSHERQSSQSLVRLIVSLLEKSVGLPYQKRAIECLNHCPTLQPVLFSEMKTPDLANRFGLLRQLHFLNEVLERGPSIVESLSAREKNPEQLLLGFLPLSLKRQILNKILSDSNSLAVGETLRLCLHVLRKLKLWSDELKSSQSLIKKQIQDSIAQRMPDLRLVVGLIEGFGPWAPQPNEFLCARAADLLCEGAKMVPSWVNENRFDWSGIFNSKKSFSCFELYLQQKILKSMFEVVRVQSDNLSSLLQPAKQLLTIILSTRSKVIYQKCRDILLLLVSKRYASSGCSIDVLKHEISCWIDGMQEECVDEFLNGFKTALASDLRGWIECAKIWKEYGMVASPSPPASPLLFHSIQKLDGASSAYRDLVCQVASRSMMFQLASRPMAAIVASLLANRKSFQRSTCEVELQQYAELLGTGSEIKDGHISRFLASSFAKNSTLTHVLRGRAEDASSEEGQNGFGWAEDHYTLVNYIRHQLVRVQDVSTQKLLFVKLRGYVSPIALVGADNPLPVIPCADGGIKALKSLPLLSFSEMVLALSYCNRNLNLVYKESALTQLLADYEARQSFLVDFLDAPVVSLSVVSKRVSTMLKLDFKNARVRKVVTKYLVHHLDYFSWGKREGQDTFHGEDMGFVDLLVNAWKELDLAQWGSVLISIQRALARILDEGSTLSHHFLVLLQSSSPEQSMCRAIEIQNFDEGRLEEDQRTLSELLILNDYVQYGSAFLSWVGKTCKAGCESQDSLCLRTFTTAFQYFGELSLNLDVKSVVANQMVDSAAQAMEIDEDFPFLVSDSLASIDADTFVLISRSKLEKLSRSLTLWLHKGKKLGAWPSVKLLKLVAHLVKIFVKNDIIVGDIENFASDSIMTFVSHVERFLRRSKKNPSEFNVQSSCTVMELFCNFWEFLAQSTTQVLREVDVATLMAFLRTCVKYGMGNDDAAQAKVIGARCLETVLLVISTSSCWCPPKSKEKGLSCEAVLFQWIISHSNFDEVLNPGGPRQEKLLLLRILLFCMRGEGFSISFEPDTWAAVLSGYGASLSDADRLTRLFLFEYHKLVPPDSTLTFMDQLKWGRRDASESGPDGWEWLPTWIELGRVNATLRRFPCEDTLIPDIESVTGYKFSERGMTRRKQKDEDRRYSLGFLLPLVLSALEGKSSRHNHGYDTNDSSHGPPHMSKALLFQKLCERGVLALVIGSLSCECQRLRRVAISILLHASKLIDSEQAKKSASWRERPQIALVLNSTRRALVKEMADSDERPERGYPSLLVPLVNPPCAIFLGKASLILTTPSDEMYPSMNRFFLRIGEDHGAVQDIQRQPAFISLFCSSASEGSLAEKERCWAIETLRDSFLNERCFGPLMACHGFELLLTRAEAMADSPDFSELDRIMSAFIRIVENSGPTGISHLTTRGGLLPWLSSLIVGRRLLDRSPRTLSDILCLICNLLENGGMCLDEDGFLMLRGVAETAVEWYVKNGAMDSSLHAGISQDLSSILRKLSKKPERLSLGQIRLQTVTRYVHGLDENDNCGQDILFYLCNLEFLADENEDSSRSELCCTILRSLLRFEEPTRLLCTAYMNCLGRVSTPFTNRDSFDHELKSLFLSVRPLCCRWAETRHSWSKLVSCIIG